MKATKKNQIRGSGHDYGTIISWPKIALKIGLHENFKCKFIYKCQMSNVN